MKHFTKYFIFILSLTLISIFLPATKAPAQGAEVSFQIFYNDLSPYGHWVDFPDEGYVWVPEVDAGFSPYGSNGYWVYTDYGWMWVSDYQWGWAPFHYGRWDFDDEYGWYWVPDYEWAPAWVAWCRAPGYYGWAPLRPGIEINSAITSGYYVPPEHWHYVPEGDLGRRDLSRHFAPRAENLDHLRNSTMVNRTMVDNSRHTTFMGGPPAAEVTKATGAPVPQYKVAERSAPGQSVSSNQVAIYRPVVRKVTADNQKPAPPKVTDLRDIKPLGARSTSPGATTTQPAPAQQSQPPKTPAANTPPQTRQNPQRTPPVAPPPARTPPPETHQNPVQQPAPKVNTPPSTPPPTPQPRLRRPQYAPPNYNSPKPNPPSQTPPPSRPAAPPQTPRQQVPPPRQAPEPKGQGNPHKDIPQSEQPPPQQN